MRIVILSDIHGNLSAFNAVLADLKLTAPDLILHGGDLADSGSSPVEIVDQVRSLGWPGVLGNTDEMLVEPAVLSHFASQPHAMQSMCKVLERMAAHTRDALGPERLSWMRALPQHQILPDLALVHASPNDCWRVPASDISDADLKLRSNSAYGQNRELRFKSDSTNAT